MSCAFLDLLSHVVFHFHVEDVRHQVECILIVLYFCVEPSEVESVRQVILIDFAEVFISSRRYELRSELAPILLRLQAAGDPSIALLRGLLQIWVEVRAMNGLVMHALTQRCRLGTTTQTRPSQWRANTTKTLKMFSAEGV